MNAADAFGHIKHSYEAGRLAHAYILAGAPRRVGIPLAERIVSLLVCEGDAKPCGECRTCRQVAARSYPDAEWVEPQTKSRAIAIEQIRAVLHKVQQTTFSGNWKACVLVGADRLNAPASNAFLKTLEEPPGQTLFLLLTDSPQSLLPTIVSRCQFLSLSEGEGVAEDWAGEVLDIMAESPAAGGLTAVFARSDRLARLLKGLRKAAEEIEKERVEQSTIEEDDDTIAARVSARYRESRAEVMRLLMHWYRDLLMAVCGADDSALTCAGRAAVIRQRAAGVTYRQACGNVRVIEEMNRRFEMNMPEGVVLTAGFMDLRG